MTRKEYDAKVLEIRARYDLIKTTPPDPHALTAYSREFRALGPIPRANDTPEALPEPIND